jgi:hypothetical protein
MQNFHHTPPLWCKTNTHTRTCCKNQHTPFHSPSFCLASQIFCDQAIRQLYDLKLYGWLNIWINVCTKLQVFFIKHQIWDLVWKFFPRLQLQEWPFIFHGSSLNPLLAALGSSGASIYLLIFLDIVCLKS